MYLVSLTHYLNMRFVFCIFLMTIGSLIASAQDYDGYNKMLENAETILYTQPEEVFFQGL